MGSCEEFVGCGKYHVLACETYVLWYLIQPIFEKGLEVLAVDASIGEILDDFDCISFLVGEGGIQQSIVLAFDCWPKIVQVRAEVKAHHQKADRD